MEIRTRFAAILTLVLALGAAPAAAQTSNGQSTQPATANPDSRLDPLQPDFTLAALPTNLRVPQNRGSFRVTHRFSRSLGRGDLGDLLSDFFGFDSGAQIGLEFRYGLLPGLQVGVHRTSDRTIQIFGQQSVWQEKPDGRPLSLDVLATFEGTNNLRAQKSAAVGLIVSKKVARVLALYAEPIVVVNSNSAAPDDASDNNTLMIGLGARARIRPTVYLVGEITPRVAGYTPGDEQVSFGIEARAGGHLFQINVSNGFGTTLGQIARGGINYDNWFIGFNISRKFF